MISLSTKADKNGFWYLIDIPEGCNFTLSYIVVGSGGRQSSGEITGSASDTRKWQFQNIGFPVLRVGVTDLHVDKQPLDRPVSPQARLQADSLPRRKAIRTFASTFLAGGAMLLFPSSPSSGATSPGKRMLLEEMGDAAGSFNPYGDEGVDSFNPYA